MAARYRRQPYFSNHYFPRAVPLAPEGGIRSRTQSGRFGSTWLARRWLLFLEATPFGERLARGRGYARSGQVTGVDVVPGRIEAKVQGTRSTPYAVTIEMPAFTAADWARLAPALVAQPRLAARLLAGDLPVEFEAVAESVDLPLLPGLPDVRCTCTCPDQTVPCKHIAAVFYLVAEEIDRDATLLLRLRGLAWDDLLSMIAGDATADEDEVVAAPAEPLPADPAVFWGAPPPDLDLAVDPAATAGPSTLLHRLGPFPFWRGDDAFLDLMDGIYAGAAAEAVELLAEPGREPEEEEEGEDWRESR